METGSRKWGRPYLTRGFFSLIGESMAEDVLLVMARRNGRWIAGAINFIGSDTLFGRNWGAIEHHPFLHFEVCYYQAIDFAIRRGLKTVEAGAQGEHKIARGYLPQTTYSAHYIADPDLRRAISDYLRHERAYVAEAGARTHRGRHRFAKRRSVLTVRRRRRVDRFEEPPCPPMTPTTPSRRSCAASFPATRYMRTTTSWPSSTSCRVAGHTLVIPKAPARNILDISPDDYAHVARGAHKIARAAMKAFKADGITVQQFNEPAGGQVVFHLHMHVMPRHDGVALLPPASRKEDVKVLEEQCDQADRGVEGR